MKTRFLTGDQILEKVRHVMLGKNKRCAVAFWSKKWVEQSGIDFGDTHVILDVSMGCTSPAAIDALEDAGAKVRHHYQLHSKIFISDHGAVIGSANASMGGLGISPQDPAQHVEASVFIPAQTDAFEDILKTFEDLQAHTYDASHAQWIAKKLYRPNRLAEDVSENFELGSLLECVLSDPGYFRNTGFVFVGSTTSKDNDDMREEDRQEALKSGENIEEIDFSKLGLFINWDEEDVSVWPERFFEFCIGQKGTLKVVYAYETVVRNQSAGRVRARKKWKKISEGRFEQKAVKKKDQNLASEIWNNIPEQCDGGRLFKTAEELKIFLGECRVNPNKGT